MPKKPRDEMLDGYEVTLAKKMTRKSSTTTTSQPRMKRPLDELDPDPAVNRAMNRYNRMILRDAPKAELREQMQKVKRRSRRAGER